MIYTVECSFADPQREAEWNDFYSLEKLPALLSVTGFHTSQRFKAVSDGCPLYLAIHTVDGPDILTGEEYRNKGGGNFARWQHDITDWHRNLYSAIGPAPAVAADELLALSTDGPEPLTRLGYPPVNLHAVALEKFPERRWMAKIPRRHAALAERLRPGIAVYAPMTEQLTGAAGVPTLSGLLEK